MGIAGKISVWLGVILLVLALLAVGIPTAVAFATETPEVLMITMLTGTAFIPAAILAVVLILVGGILVLGAKPKKPDQARPTAPDQFNPSSSDHLLRAALTTTEGRIGPMATAVWALRAIAVLLLLYLFIPEALLTIKIMRLMPDNIPLFPSFLSLLANFIMAAIIPLVLWFASMLLSRQRFQPA